MRPNRQFDRLDRVLEAACRREGTAAAFLKRAEAHAQTGSFDIAEAAMREAIVRESGDDRLLLRYALLQREADKRADSAAILDHLLQRSPADSDAAYWRALVELERGADAREHFDRALALERSPRTVLGRAAALNAAGEMGDAIEWLRSCIPSADGWDEGVDALARLLWEQGDKSGAIYAFDSAIARRPDVNGFMRKGGFLAAAEQWEAVLATCSLAGKSLPDHGGPLIAMLEAQALDESGKLMEADRAFARLEKIDDPGFVAVRARYMVRREKYAALDALHERWRGTAAEQQLWPYRAIQWQRTDPARFAWLTGDGEFVSAHRLALDPAKLEAIRAHVRASHDMRSAPHDQSARGGSQTHGNLFDRTDPEIDLLRAAVRDAVGRYIAALPAAKKGHPLLEAPRYAFRFAGSWSVLLRGGGHHVPHVHPMGWISSALYLDLPAASDGGTDDAARFFIDRPPAGLAKAAEVGRTIAPEIGTVILFPSYLWHGTVPFDRGERLTAAFDVTPFPATPPQ